MHEFDLLPSGKSIPSDHQTGNDKEEAEFIPDKDNDGSYVDDNVDDGLLFSPI